jgi:hypothetical protein
MSWPPAAEESKMRYRDILPNKVLANRQNAQLSTGPKDT